MDNSFREHSSITGHFGSILWVTTSHTSISEINTSPNQEAQHSLSMLGETALLALLCS